MTCGRRQTAGATQPQGTVQEEAGTARMEVTLIEEPARSVPRETRLPVNEDAPESIQAERSQPGLAGSHTRHNHLILYLRLPLLLPPPSTLSR